MKEKKVSYPNEWVEFNSMGLDSPATIEQDCLFKKGPILELQASLIKNYMVWYLKQYELKANINNTLKTFVEKGWSYKKDELHTKTIKDFSSKLEFESYQTNAQHLFGLYNEWGAVITNINTLKNQLLDIKRFPKDA